MEGYPTTHVEADTRTAAHPCPETDETLAKDRVENSSWRRFLSLYDSLQWHAYL